MPPKYVCIDTLHHDLHTGTVNALAGRLTHRFQKRLHEHPNTQTLQLLEEPRVRRLRKNSSLAVQLPSLNTDNNVLIIRLFLLRIIFLWEYLSLSNLKKVCVEHCALHSQHSFMLSFFCTKPLCTLKNNILNSRRFTLNLPLSASM